MLFVIKLFPEITIKSRPVRRRLIRQLRRNLRTILTAELGSQVKVWGEWDSIEVELPATLDAQASRVIELLGRIPGIALYQQVEKYPLTDLDTVADLCRQFYADQLQGKTFAVRCKRSGQHDFRSIDVEKHVGAVLNTQLATGGVRLVNPDVTVQLEIRSQDVFLVTGQFRGLGGFPLGAQDGVLSLISGGFDSAVSSFDCTRRGLLTHYCFFNLGGSAHEMAVKELALYLWLRYHSTHKVRFVTVPFEAVVTEILGKVDDSQMGVVLKRLMLRAASRIADRLKLQALVTGESIAQVSSQTLANLAIIDSVADRLTLRPLITSDKQDIINTARRIGTEEFSKYIPEYCGVISVKPTTRARADRIAREESKFDFTILDQAIADARVEMITELARDNAHPVDSISEVSTVANGDTVIDIRHPDLAEVPVPLPDSDTRTEVLKVPFYRLPGFLAEQGRSGRYLLYCDKGMMSRLHAAHLKDLGYANVAIYVPPGARTKAAISE